MPARTPARKTMKRTAAKMKLRVKAKTVKRKTAKVKLKVIGRVSHYYDRIGVAIIKLLQPLRVGDAIVIRHHDSEVTQTVESMQVNHLPVTVAKKKQVIGLKVALPVREGALIVPG